MPLGTNASNEPAGFDDDYGYSWEPLKPYLDDDTLVIPVMDVISDSFWGSCLSAKMVQRALLKHASATKIKLLVNCPGGNVTEGTAIYTLLMNDPRPVEAHVIGLAASMATVIILAADVRVLHTGCMLMVHEPALSWTGGNRHQLRSDATRLDIATESMLDIYEQRTGHDRSELAKLMAAETWLSADDGRRIGLGTEVATLAEPVMSAVRADEKWNLRRGAALAKYDTLPLSVQQGTALGWDGPSLAELREVNDFAEAHSPKTLAMALDGVRRSRAVAQHQISQREATPPPRAAAPSPSSATTGGPETITMDEETLAYLGLKPGASQVEISAAWKAKRDENTALAKAKADAEAKAEKERQDRLTAEAKAGAEEDLRKEQAAKAAAERVRLAHESDVKAFLADIMPSSVTALEKMCWLGEGDDRKPNPAGMAVAKELVASNPAMLKSSLTGESEQVARARAAEGTNPPLTSPQSQQVLYPTKPGLPPIEISRITGATKASITKRQQELVARYGTEVLRPEGYAING